MESAILLIDPAHWTANVRLSRPTTIRPTAASGLTFSWRAPLMTSLVAGLVLVACEPPKGQPAAASDAVEDAEATLAETDTVAESPDFWAASDADTTSVDPVSDVGATLINPATLLPKGCLATTKGGPVGASCVDWKSACIAVTFDKDGVCRPKVSVGKSCVPPPVLPAQAASTEVASDCFSKKTGVCQADGRCVGPVLKGAACLSADPCRAGSCDAKGACVTSVPVGTVCGESDDPCKVKRCSPSGACVAELKQGSCKTGDPCRPVGTCTATGTCDAPIVVGAVCGQAKALCQEQRCSKTGACVAVPLTGTACKKADPCQGAGVCKSGVCVTKPAPGASCDDPTRPCMSGTCDAQGACGLKPKSSGSCGYGLVCANGACIPKSACSAAQLTSGQPCTFIATEMSGAHPSCYANHVMQYIPPGSSADVELVTVVDGVCSAAGICVPKMKPTGSPCTFPYPQCRTGGTCKAGACVGGTPGGSCVSPYSTSYATRCTVDVCCIGEAGDPDECNTKKPGTCVAEPLPDGSQCDGVYTTNQEACFEGSCAYLPISPPPPAGAKERFLKDGGILPACPVCAWYPHMYPNSFGSVPIASCREGHVPCAWVYDKYDLHDPCAIPNMGAYCPMTVTGDGCVQGKPDGTCCAPGLVCKNFRCQQLAK